MAAPSHETMRQLIGERAEVHAQRQALPLRDLRDLRDLRGLDGLQREREQIRGQRADTAARLEALPEPRCKLGRTRDDHAAERGRLTAAVGATDQQLAAIDSRISELKRHVGPVEDLRQERDGLDARIGELDTQIARHDNAIAEHHVADPPPWAREMLGDCPAAPRQAEQYDRAIRTVARYRVEHDIPDSHPGVGPEPTDTTQRVRYREALSVAEQVQRRLGRARKVEPPGLEH